MVRDPTTVRKQGAPLCGSNIIDIQWISLRIPRYRRTSNHLTLVTHTVRCPASEITEIVAGTLASFQSLHERPSALSWGSLCCSQDAKTSGKRLTTCRICCLVAGGAPDRRLHDGGVAPTENGGHCTFSCGGFLLRVLRQAWSPFWLSLSRRLL